MGIVKAFSGAISGTFADQWKEIITADAFSEHTLVAPGILKKKNKGRGSDDKGSDGIISNGSKIFVPENCAAFIFSQSGIEEIIQEPGGYVYKKGQSSVLNGDGVRRSIFGQIWDRVGYGGISSEEKRVAFVNMREIRNIKFETKGPQAYNDVFYDTDLEILAHGTFSIKIDNAELFIRKYVPANVFNYTVDNDVVRSQLLSEFMQSFIVALNTLSGTYRVSQLPAQANKISSAILIDNQNAGTWSERFGFSIVKVSIESIKYTDDSRDLIKKYTENKLKLKAYEGISQEASDIAAQQKIAEGIQSYGLGNAGGMLFGMNLAQTLSYRPTHREDTRDLHDTKDDGDDVIKTIRKYKQLFDEGLITNKEFTTLKSKLLKTEFDSVEGTASQNSLTTASRLENNQTMPFGKAKTESERHIQESPQSEYKVGIYVIFGGERWYVLANSSSKYLLVKESPLSARPYHTEGNPITWEYSSLRKWLNNEYYNTISEQGKKHILRIPLRPEKNKEWTADAGNPTDDMVFCLGYREYKKYTVPKTNAMWWLRSPGSVNTEAAVVDASGEIKSCGIQRGDIMVRPAIWVDFNGSN